ncbi:MAG: caspase family protein, partial [Verrucomicrobiota bacterium]
MPTNADHFALVVGIDDYPKFKSLAGAKQDAKDFAKWLADDEMGGGVPNDNLKLILSKKNPTRPIHDDIDAALDEIFEATDNIRAERLYFFFAGHGLARSNFGADLCLATWSKRRMGLAL